MSDLNFPIVILIIALSVFFSVVAAGFFVVRKLLSGKYKNREELLENLARQINFKYISDFHRDIPDHLKSFHELSRNRSYEVLNLIEGNQNNCKWQVFQIQQTETRPGKHALISTTVSFSMVYSALADDLKLPRFALGSAGKVRETGSFKGLSKIELSGFSDFNRYFFLSGQDENAIKKLFTSEVIDYLTNLSDPILMEAEENRAVFYCPSMGGFSDGSEFMEIPAKLMFSSAILANFREAADNEGK